METIKAKCTNIVQAENRGTVMFVVMGKDKKAETQIAISHNSAKAVTKYEQGKEYSIKIDLVK